MDLQASKASKVLTKHIQVGRWTAAYPIIPHPNRLRSNGPTFPIQKSQSRRLGERRKIPPVCFEVRQTTGNHRSCCYISQTCYSLHVGVRRAARGPMRGGSSSTSGPGQRSWDRGTQMFGNGTRPACPTRVAAYVICLHSESGQLTSYRKPAEPALAVRCTSFNSLSTTFRLASCSFFVPSPSLLLFFV